MLKLCLDLESTRRGVTSFARSAYLPPLGFSHLYRIYLGKRKKQQMELSLQSLRENGMFIWLSSFQWLLLLQFKIVGHPFYHWYLKNLTLKACISHVTQRLITQFVSCHQKDILSLKLLSGLLLNTTPRKQGKIAKILFIPFRIPGSGVRKLENEFPALPLFISLSVSESQFPFLVGGERIVPTS